MMPPDEDEIRFKSVINLLKHTSKISAPPGFEADLMRQINSTNFDELNKVRWWDKLLLPSRLIPSVATAVVIIVFLVLNFNSIERENPFLTAPKIRETINTVSKIKLQDIAKQDPGYTSASLNHSITVNKEGLNFLQVRLSEADRAKINKLKAQIRDYLKENLASGNK